MGSEIAVYICDAVRTPIGRYGGALSTVRPDDLAAIAIRALLRKNPCLPPKDVGEVVLGCANQAGEDNRNVARMSLLLAGIPETVPGVTVNRLCASGLEAVAAAARLIRQGEADVVIAGGVESMSRAPYVIGKAADAFSRTPEIFDTTIGWRFVNAEMRGAFGVDSMPETAENVAAEYSVSRHDQDEFALRSQIKAARAQIDGTFAREIVPVDVAGRDGVKTSVECDEHPRETTLEALSKLRAPFRDGGCVTAGNSSGISDGACATLVASDSAVHRYGLIPLSRIVGYASAGVAPRIMGIGPVPATRKVLERCGLAISDIDWFEMNEAFAAQAIASLRKLGISADAPEVNPNGGAISLGHPLGMSGARIAATASYGLAQSGAKYALCTMCVGVGQGAAMILARGR